MEAHLQAEPYYRLTANVTGGSPEEVSATILARPQVSGLRGPTVARVYNVQEEDWYSVSLLVRKDQLMEAVDHLRECGGVDIAASQVSYLFRGQSDAYRRLLDRSGEPAGGGALKCPTCRCTYSWPARSPGNSTGVSSMTTWEAVSSAPPPPTCEL